MDSFGFLMFSMGLEINIGKKPGLFTFLVQVVLVLSENGKFCMKFAHFQL